MRSLKGDNCHCRFWGGMEAIVIVAFRVGTGIACSSGMQHRNSQKRIYVERGVYFITTNTQDRFPYFRDNALCELFVEELLLCQKLKQFELLGYKINHEHTHLLFQPNEHHNFSEIMHFLKRHSSLNINILLGHQQKYTPKATLANVAYKDVDSKVEQGKNDLAQRTPAEMIHMPRFKWQKSFHHHIIEDRQDLYNHLMYIKRQWIKHGYAENAWCYIREDLEGYLPE